MNWKRTVVMVVLALMIATIAGATLPPINYEEGPWACYRTWFYTWQEFIGWFWTDQSGDFGWARVNCYFRY